MIKVGDRVKNIRTEVYKDEPIVVIDIYDNKRYHIKYLNVYTVQNTNMLSWVDEGGLYHPIPIGRYTDKPSEAIAQDDQGEYLTDSDGSLTLTTSITEDRFKQTAFITETNKAHFFMATGSGHFTGDF